MRIVHRICITFCRHCPFTARGHKMLRKAYEEEEVRKKNPYDIKVMFVVLPRKISYFQCVYTGIGTALNAAHKMQVY